MLHYKDIAHRNHSRVSVYQQWENELNFEGIENKDAITFKDISKFEKLNQIKVNVHLWERGFQGVRYNSVSSSRYDRVVNLLLVYNEQDPHWHF